MEARTGHPAWCLLCLEVYITPGSRRTAIKDSAPTLRSPMQARYVQDSTRRPLDRTAHRTGPLGHTPSTQALVFSLTARPLHLPSPICTWALQLMPHHPCLRQGGLTSPWGGQLLAAYRLSGTWGRAAWQGKAIATAAAVRWAAVAACKGAANRRDVSGFRRRRRRAKTRVIRLVSRHDCLLIYYK